MEDDTIFRQDEDGHELYFISRGDVKIVMR